MTDPMSSSDDIATDEDIPPWHPWCGCAGCKAGDRVWRKYIAPTLEAPR